MTKILSPTETAKVLAETVALLNAVVETSNMLHQTLIAFRERGVRLVVGDATAPDAETDREFDTTVEILRLMGATIPLRVTNALLAGDAIPQGVIGLNTTH